LTDLLRCLKRRSPFDDDDWLFELKYDGFRALAIIEHGRAHLLSRNGHLFASFSALAESISGCLPNARAVIDGEICSLDKLGRPQFKNLLFHRGNPPCFFAFDLLTWNGKDLRTERLLDRKQELRRVYPTQKPVARVARSSACPAFSSIRRSTRSQPQRITGKTKNGKPLKGF
jgi:bifunctional non-homologous end joining protein LigD